METYENKKYAALMATAIKLLAAHPERLDNFESYLAHSFPTWLEKFASTPEQIAHEFLMFAEME